MDIIKINKNHPDSLLVKKAVKILKQGGVIIYPTDTAYALGCDSLNKPALARIFKIKKRPAGKPVPFIAGSVAMVKKFCRIDKILQGLIKKYWPGALTVVLKVKSYKVCKVVGKNKTMAVRVPDCQIARLLSQKLGRPIVSTSANLAGKEVCYSVPEVLRQFGIFVTELRKSPDLILDAGRLPRRKPSTIVKVVGGKLEIIRQGQVKCKM